MTCLSINTEVLSNNRDEISFWKSLPASVRDGNYFSGSYVAPVQDEIYKTYKAPKKNPWSFYYLC
ncbi:hypothetical protein [Tenacibaculum sp. 190524A02b]|uniref:hypothetical protein n=1 Tax=Tenacibaculum vairaonense TaxID=3137860 RepID=UPI0032B107E6